MSDVFVCSVRITTGDRYRIAGPRVGHPRVVGEKLQSGLATVECGGKRAKRNREKGPRSNTLGTPCRKENNRPFTSTVRAVAQSMRMEEHQDPNYQTDHPRKRGWWSCQLCGCSHFHGEEFCGGCGTPKAAAAQEPPSKLLEPLWRDKEEKGRAAETAYRDWRRAESLNIERIGFHPPAAPSTSGGLPSAKPKRPLTVAPALYSTMQGESIKPPSCGGSMNGLETLPTPRRCSACQQTPPKKKSNPLTAARLSSTTRTVPKEMA